MSSVTVLSGPERRRRWSAAERARNVEESLRPGSTRFIEVTFTDEIRPFYRLEEMSDDAGRAAVLASRRVQAMR
jgi:hypothetical protein